MIVEDDDDTHICLKCHTTITGLDNYVAHRKSGCGNQGTVHSKSRTLSPLIPQDEHDFSLKADDFFSLLELQSSNKKSALQVSTPGKNNSGVLTRSKATAVIQASSTGKETFNESDKRDGDWLGEHHLRELEQEENHDKLISSVNAITENHLKKDETAQFSYGEEEDSNEEYEDDDEDEEEERHNGPPRTHTGGKWKPSSSPIQWLRPSSSHSTHDYRNDWNNPPPSHTGGKWKPTLPTHARLYDGDKSDDEDKSVPPPGHTKGKWIPGRSSGGEIGSGTANEEIPPLRKSSGTVQYWCGSCQRRLASKIVYERHLRSDLHLKRTLHEREFDEPIGYSNSKTQKRSERKRSVRKPENRWLGIEYNKKKSFLNHEFKTEFRIKKRNYIRCEVCKSKVLTHLMGKHLISHYHCRKRNVSKVVAQQMVLDYILSVVQQAPFQCAACRFFCNKESDFLRHWRSAEHKDTVEKTDGFFLCSFCDFECEENDTMEEHLLTFSHREVISVINRSVPIVIKQITPIRCITCGRRFRLNVELRRHCARKGHAVATSAGDEYQQRHKCSDCSLIFKSNISLQRHLQRRHGKNYFFCSVCSLTFDTYLDAKLHRRNQQHKHAALCRKNEKNFGNKDLSKVCKYCFLRFSNILLLKNHLQEVHPEHAHVCPKCGKRFTLSQEVTRHIRDKACTFEETSTSYLSCTKCPYKSDSEADLIFHEALHSEPLSYYETHSKDVASHSKKPPSLQYKCPVCNVFYKKASLRCHIRLHTNERPFICQICKASYTRNSNLMDHKKTHHPLIYNIKDDSTTAEETNSTSQKKTKDDDVYSHFENNQKKFLCSFCGKSFLKKFTLQQHLKLHTGKDVKCPHEGCVFTSRSAADLRPHLLTHSELRPYACQICDYCAKTKPQLLRHVKTHGGEDSKTYSCSHCTFTTRLSSHLRRHLRVHTGAKPYLCPHCNYTSSNLENLRKHVLLTNKHKGKCIYECKFCEDPDEYATNFAKEFRVHLYQSHPEQFSSLKEAASYVVGIYNANDDDPKLAQLPMSSQLKSSSNEKVLKKNKDDKNSKMMQGVDRDPHIGALSSVHSQKSSILLTSAASHEPQSALRPVDSEFLSMVVVSHPKDEVVYMLPSTGAETWTMEGYYDVEESGTLVPFHSDRFSESFDNESP